MDWSVLLLSFGDHGSIIRVPSSELLQMDGTTFSMEDPAELTGSLTGKEDLESGSGSSELRELPVG